MRAPAPSSDVYRRCARRLRARYESDPLKRALALRQLSTVYDRVAATAESRRSVRSAAAAEVLPLDRGGVRAFVQRVEAQFEREGPTLLYSRRMKLLRSAQRDGIRRFDANLIIAAVQERTPRHPPDSTGKPRGGGLLHSAAMFLLVQLAIVIGAGLILFS